MLLSGVEMILLGYFALEFVTPKPLSWRQNSRLKLLVHHEHRIQVDWCHIPTKVNNHH